MPYGIKGETPKQTAFMERCVSGISGTNKRTKKAYTKSEKVAICKAQLSKTKESEYDDAVSEDSLRQLEDKLYRALNPSSIDPYPSSPYIMDVFESYIIVSKGDKNYKVEYSVKGDDVTVNWDTAIEVFRKTTFEEVASEDDWQPKKVINSRRTATGYRI